MQKSDKYSLWLFCLITCCFILFNPFLCHSQNILYYLEIDEQSWNSIHVRISVERIDQSQLVFIMPAWRPGEFIWRDFGQHVLNFEAFGESGQLLTTTRLNSGAWSVEVNNNPTVRVEYDVDYTSIRSIGTQLNPRFAIVNGAMNFMYIKGKKHLPLKVNYRVPHGWKLATGLPEAQASFEYNAQNYDHFIDCPVLMSIFRNYYFTIKHNRFHVIIIGREKFDINQFMVMLKRIVSYQTDFFREIPFEKYFFLIQVSTKAFESGSIDYSNSTYIKFSEKLLLQNIKDAANIVAHEFFQAWNAKRIHPTILGPFDYTQQVFTKNLWFCEGVTNYYADLTLIRAKIWSEQEFLEHQAKLIEDLLENPDRLKTSVEKASLDTWRNGPYTTGISYNKKGHLIGMLLDLTMRELTNNKCSLDDLMCFLNWWFAKKNIGYQEDDILRAVSSLTSYDFSDFFNKYISGTVELPFEQILNYAGILVEMKKDTVPGIGLLKIKPENNEVIALNEAGPLAKAGLRRGDYIQAINGQTIEDINDIPSIVKSLNIIDEKVQITAERDGIRLNFYTIIGQKEKVTTELRFLPEPGERQLKIRRGWLDGVTCN